MFFILFIGIKNGVLELKTSKFANKAPKLPVNLAIYGLTNDFFIVQDMGHVEAQNKLTLRWGIN